MGALPLSLGFSIAGLVLDRPRYFAIAGLSITVVACLWIGTSVVLAMLA